MKMMEYKNCILPKSTPEEQGISSEDIIRFMDEIERQDCHLHSFQIVRHGKIIAGAVASPFTEDSYHRIFSAAKGVVATGILTAVQEGYFSLDDKVTELLSRESLPEKMDPKWDKLTVYRLLTMTTGHKEDTLFRMFDNGEYFKTFFEEAPEYDPGTYFCYDMGAQYVMNEIIKQKAGKDLGEFLNPRIFQPMGIEYQHDLTPDGRFFSSTIQFKPDALTKFAQLYLQEGKWNGKELIRQDLARLAARCNVPNDTYDDHYGIHDPDDYAGYGLHMWRNAAGGYRFCGGQGQLAVIFPEYDIAMGTMAAEDDCNVPLKAFVNTVLYKCSERPLPENQRGYKALCRRLKAFTMAPAASDRSSMAEEISGREYIFTENGEGQKRIKFVFRDEHVSVFTSSQKGDREYVCGLRGEWKKNRGWLLLGKKDGDIADLDRILFYDPEETLLSGGWKSLNTFEIRMRSHAMLCDYRFLIEFNGKELEAVIKTKAHEHHGEGEAVGLYSTAKNKRLYARQEDTI